MRIRRPVSRVLCRPRRDAAVIPLDRPLLAGSRDLPGRLGPARPCRGKPRRDVPIRSCSRRGLPCRPRHRVRGGLLPHPFTLPLLRRRLRRASPPKTTAQGLSCVASAEQGGLLSVALSLGSPPAGVTRRLVAVEPGLSSTLLRRGFAGPRPPGRLIRAESEGLWPLTQPLSLEWRGAGVRVWPSRLTGRRRRRCASSDLS